MKPKIYLTRKIPSPGIEILKQYCDVNINQQKNIPSKTTIIKNIKNVDGLLCLLTDTIDADVINSAKNLKVISTYSVGFNHIDVKTATEKGIYVTYTPGILTDAVADLTFALIFAVARRIVEADSYIRLRKWKISWSPDLFLGLEVFGKTLGIIGIGRIGRAVVDRAKGFNMKILYYDPIRLSDEDEKKMNVEFQNLEDLLKNSDIVSIHCPLLPNTKYLIDYKKISLMKKSAILINTARGPIIKETDLIKALKRRLIAGAGLDVFEQEPLPQNSQLLKLPNVVLLPHIASATSATRSKMAEISATNLINIFQGKQPLSLVNPEVKNIRPLNKVKMI